MADNSSYLDRLYNEIGQYGERFKATFGGSGGLPQILENWKATYQPSYSDSVAEQNRLSLQQAKEKYIEQQDAGKLSKEQAIEAQNIREKIDTSIQDLERRTGTPTASPAKIMGEPASVVPYDEYIRQNETLLMAPQGQYAAPTREEYQKYFVEGQAPEKVARVERVVPAKQTPKQQELVQARRVVEQPAQQRPMTLEDYINSFKFEGDRYEARRKAIESLKIKKINEANDYITQVFGPGTVEGDRELGRILKQIDANYQVPKPIEETEAFKSAQQALVSGKHPDKLVMLGEMKGLLESAKQIKDKREKVSFLEVNLPKLAQSIAAGADAIQPAEAARIMPELNTILQEPSQLFSIVGRKGIADAFSKQPDAFIEKLSKLYNASYPVLNERSVFYNNQLGNAFQKLGAGYLTPIGEKNQGLDITKLQQLREGRQVQQPIFSQTNPMDRPAQTGPQIVPGMRFGTSVPSTFQYGTKPVQLGF